MFSKQLHYCGFSVNILSGLLVDQSDTMCALLIQGERMHPQSKVFFLLAAPIFLLLTFHSSQARAIENTQYFDHKIGKNVDVAQGEILIKFNDTFSTAATDQALDVLYQQFGIKKIKKLQKIKAFRLKIPSNKTIEDIIAKIKGFPGLEYAEPNHVVSISSIVPNDTYYSQQWGLTTIKADQGWDSGTGNSSITIAVVDSGVDYYHPDLKNKIIFGYDFVNADNDPRDDEGHGTHVAGIAGAVSNNGLGIAGVCWNCKIMAVKVLDADGKGYSSDIADGIIYAADNGARVINLSIGGPSYSSVEANAVAYAMSKNVLVVASAGNESSYSPSYPAAFDGVLSVAATDQQSQKADFSNMGGAVDVAAPGVDILSTVMGGGYEAWAGTSMAAPFVAGLAGLIISSNPALSYDAVSDIIINSSTDLGATGRDDYFGYGLINVYKATCPGCFNLAPALSWTGETNYTADGLHPETGVQSGTAFSFRVKYKDPNGDAPMNGYPKVHLLKGGVEVSGSPILMTRVSGTYSAGAVYEWRNTLGLSGTDFTYYFEAKDVYGAPAAGAPAGARDAPDIYPGNNALPVLSWTGQANYTADGLHPETGVQSATYFAFRVKYTDANGDAPMSGYPRVHLLKGGNEVSGSPIPMTLISGAYSTGAIYQWANMLGITGTDFTYYFEARDSRGAIATGAPASPKDAPNITEMPASILLVDDDDGASFESYYKAALSANGLAYHEWNVAAQGSLTSAKAAAYSTIIWFTGNDYSGTLTFSDQSVLQTFLNNGGRLFISGQEIGYGISGTYFYSNYLHAAYVNDDVNLGGLHGITGDSITSGLYLGISNGDGASNQAYPDEIDPLAPAISILNYDAAATTVPLSTQNAPQKTSAADVSSMGFSSSGSGGLRVDTGTYKIVYLAFGFEAINSASSRNLLMKNAITWLQAPLNTAPTLSWTGEANFTSDGVHPETGAQSSTYFAFRVKYTDANGDAPLAGYPRIHLLKGGAEVPGSPIPMTRVAGTYSSGAIYQWANTLGISGSDFSYYFEARDSIGDMASGAPTSIKNAPDVSAGGNSPPMLSWTGETNYTADGLNPETGTQNASFFVFRVKYTDANGDAPLAGYPKIHLLKGGAEVPGSPIPMARVAGNYSSGAIYQWANTLGISGSDFSYYFEARDSKGDPAAGTPTSAINAPDVAAAPATILLVSDAGGSALDSYYKAALSANGFPYHEWLASSQGTLTSVKAASYSIIIWFTGNDAAYTLTAAEQSVLQTFLDNGGSLFLTGQEIGFNIGGSSFYANYLHSAYVADDVNLYGLNGVSGDAITGGMNLGISGGDGAGNQYYPDEINPIAPAVSILNYNPAATTAALSMQDTPPKPGAPGSTTQGIYLNGCGGLRVDTGAYKVVYLSFGFEAINSTTARNALMYKVITWLQTAGNTAPTLSWTGESNYTADGLNPESGAQGSTYFTYRVKYTDANGDAPMAGYPRLHLLKAGVELSGSPITMTHVSGAYSSGAIYQWSNTLGLAGTDFTYFFDAKDNKGNLASGAPAAVKNAPDITAGNVAPVLSWSGQAGYTNDGLEPDTGIAGVSYFDYRVKYTDANGDAPMAGYPKLHIRKNGVELSGSPITMSLMSGTPLSGAIYRWANTLGISGTDFTYYYEARDNKGATASGTPANSVNAPDISGAARVATSVNQAADSLTISLAAGWNPVSLPFDTTASELTEIIGNNAVLISGGMNAQPENSGAFPAGAGIWIYSDRPLELLTASREPANAAPLNVAAGWNMVGNPFLHTINFSDNLSFENTLLSQKLSFAGAVKSGWLDHDLYEYSPADDLYFVKRDKELLPVKACFIKSNVPLRIHFQSTQ